MAEEGQYTHQQPKTEEVESTDRGLFDFMGKKPTQEEVIASEFDNKAKICEDEHVVEPKIEPKVEVEEEKKHSSLLEKLHRSDGSSSSSSDEEEVEEGGEKKKKKKEKKSLKEKILGEKKEEETSVPVEKYEEGVVETPEKKGILEKIKEKLPGNKAPLVETPPPAPVALDHHPVTEEVEEHKEKKGILEKIKEKLPGYHAKPTEEEKEKESDAKTSNY
jgi:hypothetical protein